MKKSIAVLVSIVTMLIGTACAGKTVQNTEPPVRVETAALSTETEIKTDNVQQEQSIAETPAQLQELPTFVAEDDEAQAILFFIRAIAL